jgi:hypothetical protein
MNREMVELNAKVDRWRDEVQALKTMLSTKSTLEDDCRAVKKSVDVAKADITKYRRRTLLLCKKLLMTTAHINNRAAASHNNILTEKLQTLGSPLATSRDETLFEETQSDSEDDAPENVIIVSSFDPQSVWRTPTTPQLIGIHARLENAKRQDRKLQTLFHS